MSLNPLDRFCPRCKAEMTFAHMDEATGEEIHICRAGDCNYEKRTKNQNGEPPVDATDTLDSIQKGA